MSVSRPLLLFSFIILCLGWLGKRANPGVELYTLDDRLLILKQGEEGNLAILAINEREASEQYQPSDNKRAPASELTRKEDLSKRRKVKTLLASIEEPRLNLDLETQALRQRQVSVDSEGLYNLISELSQQSLELNRLDLQDRSFELNLFKDSSFLAVIDSLSASNHGGFLIKGHLNNVPGSQFIMIQEGLIVLADIAASNEHQFEMRFSEGAHVISQLDPVDWSNTNSGPGHSFRTGSAPGKIILAYTPSLRATQGGEAGMQTLAQLALVKALSADKSDLNDAILTLERMEIVELDSDDVASSAQGLLIYASQSKAEQAHILTQSNTQIVAL